MLRKRTRSLQKEQQMGSLTLMSGSGSEPYFQSDFAGHSHKTNPYPAVPGLFVGLCPKGLSDCDAVRSPTSPLDFRLFSNLANPNKSPRSWDCSKVGLSIVDSLDEDTKGPGKVLRPSESKNILFGPQVRNKTPTHTNSFEAPKSLPKNFAISHRTYTKSPLHKGSSNVLFEIGEGPLEPEPFGRVRSSSMNSCNTFSTLSRSADLNCQANSENCCFGEGPDQLSSSLKCLGAKPNSNNSSANMTLTSMSVSSGSGFIGGLSASEIELSEDYTCVISHGPNPTTTHIYCDCILECTLDDMGNASKIEGKGINAPQVVTSAAIPSALPSNDFLSFCNFCHKKLEEGKDIYIYRGEKAFCSLSCRSQEIMIDEELDETINMNSEDFPKEENGEEMFSSGLFYA